MEKKVRHAEAKSNAAASELDEGNRSTSGDLALTVVAVPPTRNRGAGGNLPGRKRGKRGMAARTEEAFRAEVLAACMDELRETLGDGAESKIAGLKRHFPTGQELKARPLFSAFRKALIDVAVFAKVQYDEQQRRILSGGELDESKGVCAFYLEEMVQELAPVILAPKMAIPAELRGLLSEAPADAQELRRAAVRAKQQADPWGAGSPRSLLVSLLDRFNILDLPSRDLHNSRFLSARELALLSLLLGIGVLDDPAMKHISNSKKITVAGVIREEERRVRVTLKRHGWDPSHPRNRARRGPA